MFNVQNEIRRHFKKVQAEAISKLYKMWKNVRKVKRHVKNVHVQTSNMDAVKVQTSSMLKVTSRAIYGNTHPDNP